MNLSEASVRASELARKEAMGEQRLFDDAIVVIRCLLRIEVICV